MTSLSTDRELDSEIPVVAPAAPATGTAAANHDHTVASEVVIEGILLVRSHMRRRRYCVLRGRVLHVFGSKEEATKRVAAKKQTVVAGVKDAVTLDTAMRATLLGRSIKQKHVERSIVISTEKSKLVVYEAETPTEKLRWLHALMTLNLASLSSERALCLSLVDDGKNPFDAHIAVSLLHKYRNNATMVELVIDRLETYTEANVDDVEFYIPQIMHLLLNTEVVKTEKLVELLLSICRAKSYVEHLGNSIHLALQLFWLLEAKIQDHDPKTYNLCAKLLMSIEAKVVNQHLELPSAASTDDIAKLFAKIPNLKAKLEGITTDATASDQVQVRAPSLSVDLPDHGDVRATAPPPAPATQKTVGAGNTETDNQPAPVSSADEPNTDDDAKERRALLFQWMEGERKKRYRYFHDQRDFVRALTDISEHMRAIEPPPERKKHLPASLRRLAIPEMAYIPLGNVSDPFARIMRVLPDEGTVFSTHSRAPCLLCFEVIEDSADAVTAGGYSQAFQAESPRRGWTSPRLTRASSTSSVGSGGSSVLDEEAAVASIVKKLAIGGKLLCVDPNAAMDDQSSSSSLLMSPTNEQVPLEEMFNSSVKELEEEWKDGSRGSLPISPPCSLPISPTQAAAAANDAATPADPCHVVRRQSKAAYDQGLSKLLTESGVFGESWSQKKERLRAASPHGSLPGWNVISLISKSNDDIRQEVFAMQLIAKFQEIFTASQLPLWLRPYRIVSTGRSCGLIETITDAQSLDALKKHKDYEGLRQHFERTYGHGDASSAAFKTAQRHFLHSLVAYSLVCYLLQIKDRHNGNILLDTEGRLVHIDFGFMLGIAPGGAWSFETAPFKLTKEMVAVLGGVSSPLFGEFVRLFALGLLAAQRHADQITTLVEIMMHNSTFPCFRGRDVSRDLHKLRARFLPDHSTEQTVKAVVKMIGLSYRNKWTKRYDQFQKLTNGIVP